MANHLGQFMAAFIFIGACFLQSLSLGLDWGLEATLEKVASNELPCPDPVEIAPCVCSIYVDMYMGIECSAVTSEEELKNVFNRPLPFNDFRWFSMLSNMYVTTLSEGIFGDATFTYFTINEGALTTVAPNALLGSASTLEHLRIVRANLSSFPFEELPQYELLTQLDLQNNSLTAFPSITSPTLNQLTLDDNPIQHIPLEAFDHIPSIREFSCVHCEIDELLTGTFSQATKLEKISLGGNILTYLHKDAIELHGTYAALYLSQNNIYNASVNAVRGATGQVTFNSNELTVLPQEVWKPVLETANGFYAYDNPLLCGCDIAWLILNPDYMAKLSGSETCSNGEYLKNLDPRIYEELC